MMLWVLLALVLVGAAVSWRRSEVDRVRGELEALAKALEFEDRAEALRTATRLKAALAERVADPVIIAIEPQAETNAARDSLLESFVGFSAELSALTVTLQDISVKLDAGKKRATAKGETLLVLVDVGGVRRSEPRKFAVTLERAAHGWVVVQARLSAPRIDQPEARP